MDINTDNITALLKEQIAKFEGAVDVSEVGEIISVVTVKLEKRLLP